VVGVLIQYHDLEMRIAHSPVLSVFRRPSPYAPHCLVEPPAMLVPAPFAAHSCRFRQLDTSQLWTIGNASAARINCVLPSVRSLDPVYLALSSDGRTWSTEVATARYRFSAASPPSGPHSLCDGEDGSASLAHSARVPSERGP